MIASCMTSSSMDPKNSRSIGTLQTIAATLISRLMNTAVYSSCHAQRQACFTCLDPMNWETTTAPPVESAAMMEKIRLLIMSTRETPEMAASPTEATIMVSAMPTVMASACSKTSGMISFFRSLEENRYSMKYYDLSTMQ